MFQICFSWCIPSFSFSFVVLCLKLLYLLLSIDLLSLCSFFKFVRDCNSTLLLLFFFTCKIYFCLYKLQILSPTVVYGLLVIYSPLRRCFYDDRLNRLILVCHGLSPTMHRYRMTASVYCWERTRRLSEKINSNGQ